MKKTSKKIVGGILVVFILATVGVVFATAQDDGTTEEFTLQENFLDRHDMDGPGSFNNNLTEHGFFCFDLTEEQQAEIDELRTSLQNQGANYSEIQKVINEKLDEFGVFDQRLENEIEQTEQRLQMLNREKELREQGYSWDEIRTIIQDEFGIEYPIESENHDMMGRHGFGKGPCRSPDGFMPGEESNQ
jgi:Spy/CpxP family protein refolding chaperone